jgi:hypothetical protein
MASSTFQTVVIQAIFSLEGIAVAALIIASYLLNAVYCSIVSRSQVARIPRLGKSLGWFGFDVSRRNFEVNGRNIVTNGYWKVSSLIL